MMFALAAVVKNIRSVACNMNNWGGGNGMKKETALNEIVKHYIKSHDFNGLPVYSMEYYDYNILCELIDEGLIEVLSEKEVINPHIKAFDLYIPVDQQKENI